MSTTTMLIFITTLSLASATGQYSLALARRACDEDAARALKRPWAPVVFHGERETESLPEIDARFTPDGHADEAAGFRPARRRQYRRRPSDRRRRSLRGRYASTRGQS